MPTTCSAEEGWSANVRFRVRPQTSVLNDGSDICRMANMRLVHSPSEV